LILLKWNLIFASFILWLTVLLKATLKMLKADNFKALRQPLFPQIRHTFLFSSHLKGEGKEK